jgi:DNA-binding response OmpR family regulator
MDQKAILIIDDDRNNATVLKELLEKEGFFVFTAYDSAEGLQKIQGHTPDLILLDLVLPDESGFRTAHLIKATPATKDTPIIAISLKTEEIDKHIAAKSGIVDYLEKPLDFHKLIFKIRDLLR